MHHVTFWLQKQQENVILSSSAKALTCVMEGVATKSKPNTTQKINLLFKEIKTNVSNSKNEWKIDK